jgi:hypothetical protein
MGSMSVAMPGAPARQNSDEHALFGTISRVKKKAGGQPRTALAAATGEACTAQAETARQIRVNGA